MLRPRTMGLMDELQKMFQGDTQASPISTSMQSQMQRGTQFGGPEAAMGLIDGQMTRATAVPTGQDYTAALQSPAPIGPSITRPPQSPGMPTPPQVMTVDQRPDLNQEARSQMPDMGGAGVRLPPEQLAEQAAKAVDLERRNPDVKSDPGFMSSVKNFFGNRENMLRLAAGFNSMRLRPDQGLAAMINQELTSIREAKTEEQEERQKEATRNRTASYFRSVGRDDLAQLVEMNIISGRDAVELNKDSEGTVVTAEQLRQQFPGTEIQDGLYNIKPNGNINKVGGGGVNVQVGGPETVQPGLESAGKTIFEQDIAGAEQATTALRNISKTDEVLRLLDEGQPVTGLTAPVQDVINNARAMLGDQDAIKSASDTGLLNALLGQEVFGSITALGIGARGLDTPAEREFLREVMAGTITMNEETIRKIAKLRRKYATEVIERYNDKIDRGDYDMLNQTFKNRYQKIEIPNMPELEIPPVPENLPAGATPDMWPDIYRSMSPQERALFFN